MLDLGPLVSYCCTTCQMAIGSGIGLVGSNKYWLQKAGGARKGPGFVTLVEQTCIS